MKSTAGLVFLGLVLGVLTVSSAVAETSKDVVNGDEAKKVNVRRGGWSGAGSGYGGKCKYGYCCGRGYHGSCQKCCKSAEEAKHMGTETTTPQKAEEGVQQAEEEVLDTAYNSGGGGGNYGGGGGNYGGGGGHGGNCRYGYCCGRGYHGSCQKCCKSAEEAKLMGTEISTADEGVQQAEGEVLDTTYNSGGGGGNYGGGGGNYGGGGGHGGNCRYGYCCGRGYHGSCQKCCKSAEEAKLMGTEISTADEGVQQAEGEVLDTTYNSGGGGGNYGGGGGNYGGGGGHGGNCRYGYCCGRGYHGSCQKCCKSAEEAKLMGTEISTADEGVQQAEEEVLDTTYKGGSGGGNYGGGSGQGGKCRYGYCCGRGYHGSCQKCCKSAQEAKLMGTEEGVQQAEGEVLDTTYKGGSGGGKYGGGGGNYGGGGGHGGKCRYGYCCGRGYHGSCQKCCKSAQEAKLIGT